MARAGTNGGTRGRGRLHVPGTPATVALTRAGIVFQGRTYEHDPSATNFGAEAAEALGVEPERVFKTLLVSADGQWAVGIVPVVAQLDLKAMAVAIGVKKVTMADPADAERLTGYVVGGISPIGQKKRLTTVLDESAFAYPSILVSGGRRGFDIGLTPADLIRVTGAAHHRIAAHDSH